MEKKYDIIGLATPGQDLVVELEKMPQTVSSRMYDCCFQDGLPRHCAPQGISECGLRFAGSSAMIFSVK